MIATGLLQAPHLEEAVAAGSFAWVQNSYSLLDRAVEIAQAGFARNCPIARTFDPSLPFAMVNGDALVQVMLNLVKNAAEAIGTDARDGEIEFTTAFRPPPAACR